MNAARKEESRSILKIFTDKSTGNRGGWEDIRLDMKANDARDNIDSA